MTSEVRQREFLVMPSYPTGNELLTGRMKVRGQYVSLALRQAFPDYDFERLPENSRYDIHHRIQTVGPLDANIFGRKVYEWGFRKREVSE